MKSQPLFSPDPSVSLQERAALGALNAEAAWALNHRDTLPDKLQGCCEAIVRHLDAAFARIWTLNEKDNVLELQASAGLYPHTNGPHSRVPVGQFKIGRIAEERKPHLTNQVAGDPRVADQEWAKREGMVAFAGYPLLVENRLLGVVAMFARHPLTEATLQALAVLSDHIAWSIDRKRMEGELAYERNLLRTLLENSPDTIYFKDLQSRFVRVSRSKAEKTFAMELARHQAAHPAGSAEQLPVHLTSLERFTEYLMGKTDFDHYSEAKAREFYEDEQAVIRTGVPLIGKLSQTTIQDGREAGYIISRIPWRDQDGKIIGTFGITKDITEHKRAEAALVETSALLETLLLNTTDSIYFKDLSSRFVHFSRRMLEVFHLTRPDELKGKTDFDFFTGEHARAALATEQEILRTGRPIHDLEEKETHRDGHVTWVLTSKMPWRDKADNIIGTMGISRDITERKRIEQTLRASEEHMRLQTAALESAANGVTISDCRGTILWVNAAFTQLTGYSAAEAVGQNPRVLKSGQHPDAFYKAMWKTISTGHVWKGEVINRRKDGRLYHEEMTITPVRDAGGAITHYIAIKQDISARKRTEAELETAHKQLLEASRLAGMAEIATNVLHNVGNVLNSVNVSASLAIDNVKNSKTPDLARVVALMQEHAPDLGEFVTNDSKGRHLPAYLAQLSEQLLAEQTVLVGELGLLGQNVEHIKRIVAMQQSYAQVSGVKEIVNLRELVEDSLRMNEGALDRHGVAVIREFADVPLVSMDRHKVLQVIVNLIRNAKQACQESGRTDRRLTVRMASRDGRINISVMDNGVGIQPENMTRIFNHGFTTRKEGHGYGLHSGALAAKEMGGSLTAHSDGPGRGATFTLELPIDPATRAAT